MKNSNVKLLLISLQKINCILFIVFALQQNILAYNILFLVPFPGPSHYIFIGNFIKELIARGHDVTSITNFKLSESSAKYKEILIDPPYDLSVHGNDGTKGVLHKFAVSIKVFFLKFCLQLRINCHYSMIFGTSPRCTIWELRAVFMD